jgi:hypothetical protein
MYLLVVTIGLRHGAALGCVRAQARAAGLTRCWTDALPD